MDRITEKHLEALVKNLSRITQLTYRYEHNMSWHTLYCENSYVCTSNNKRAFYDQLYAIQTQLYILERMNKLS